MRAAKLASRLGIQIWCFRGLKGHEELIRALRECGVDKVELSGIHLDPAGKAEDTHGVLEMFKQEGITLNTIGVVRFDVDEAKAARVLEFARWAKLSTVNATLGLGGEQTCEKLCPRYGIKIAIHNHGRKDPLGSVHVLQELFARTSPHIGLCLDTGWMLDSGEDPLEVAERFRPRLYGLHIKDFVFDRSGRPSDVVVGEGNLDLGGLAKFLSDTEYDFPLTLEYEGEIDNPVPATKQCVDAIRALFAAIAQK